MTYQNQANWYQERILFLIAATVTLIGLIAGVVVNQWWLLLNFLVSINMILFATVRICPMAFVLTKLGVPRRCDIEDGIR